MASLPRAQTPLADRGGYPTREWYAFWAGLQAGTSDPGVQAQIAAILARIEAIEDETYPTLAQGPGIQVIGILANGYAQVRLALLEDSGVGDALVKITRDVYGRIAGTEAATTSDLAEGSNLYYTDARADARVDAGIATHVGESDPHTQYMLRSDLASLQDAVDDAAAALLGVAVGELYRNGSIVMIRVT